MDEELFQRRPPRSVQELNIVPVLDMLVTVIFFLLLATGFTRFTHIGVPPVTTGPTPASSKTPELPRLFLTQDGTALRVRLSWEGASAGGWSESVDSASPARREEILRKSSALAERFLA